MALPTEVSNEKRNYRRSARERKYIQPVVQVILSCLAAQADAKPIPRVAFSCVTRGRLVTPLCRTSQARLSQTACPFFWRAPGHAGIAVGRTNLWVENKTAAVTW